MFSPCIEEMFTTAGPTADAALAIEFLPRHPGQHLESPELPSEPWSLWLAGETDADVNVFSIGNPRNTFGHSKIFNTRSSILPRRKVTTNKATAVSVSGKAKMHFSLIRVTKEILKVLTTNILNHIFVSIDHP